MKIKHAEILHYRLLIISKPLFDNNYSFTTSNSLYIHYEITFDSSKV